SNNQISEIPESLAQLTCLGHLDLSNNPGDLRRNNIPARQSLCRRIRQAINGTLSKRKSLGQSLVCYPSLMTHQTMPEKERLKRGITTALLGLSIGIENRND
ncbi:MAG: PLP-dependent transferase, partial [Microcystis sp.]